MPYLDANKTAGEEARRQLQKNAASNIEQVQEAHSTKHQLYGHLPPITKTIQFRRTTHARHCWRKKDELTSDVLLWTPTYGRAKSGRPARTYIQQLCEDMGCSPEDLPEAMNDSEKWREKLNVFSLSKDLYAVINLHRVLTYSCKLVKFGKSTLIHVKFYAFSLIEIRGI